MIKRKLGFILALALGLTIPFMSSRVEALAAEPTESQIKSENSQSYITPEGDSRKVYWAEGIEAPYSGTPRRCGLPSPDWVSAQNHARRCQNERHRLPGQTEYWVFCCS